jgi:hypothetical protein
VNFMKPGMELVLHASPDGVVIRHIKGTPAHVFPAVLLHVFEREFVFKVKRLLPVDIEFLTMQYFEGFVKLRVKRTLTKFMLGEAPYGMIGLADVIFTIRQPECVDLYGLIHCCSILSRANLERGKSFCGRLNV